MDVCWSLVADCAICEGDLAILDALNNPTPPGRQVYSSINPKQVCWYRFSVFASNAAILMR